MFFPWVWVTTLPKQSNFLNVQNKAEWPNTKRNNKKIKQLKKKMVQIFASYIILNQDYAFRSFLLEFRHFQYFAYDHSGHWPLRRKEDAKNGFSLTFLHITGVVWGVGAVQQGTW